MNKNKLHACIATNRFGLGARPGQIELAKTDPQGWLLGQLRQPRLTPSLTDSNAALVQIAAYNAQRKEMRENNVAQNMMSDEAKMLNPRHIYDELCGDTLKYAIASDDSLNYRLLDFFSNHFSVSATNAPMRALAPTLEREAISPYVMGRFEDMLVAVSSHPAMLIYLNNEQSIGPNSKIGQRRKERGLNENLAREILELHTLGVNGGYSQADVIELAKALTGWGVLRPGKKQTRVGFTFRAAGHEPGTRTILGKKYREGGVKQAESVLRDLAVHPSTAKYVSTKLARHFIADEPSEKLVKKLESTWMKTGGDLREVVKTLVLADESWELESQKFKTPREFLVSTLRASGDERKKPRFLMGALTELGQKPFDAGSPAGFSDVASGWDGADAIYRRVELVARFAKQFRGTSAVDLAVNSLGDMLSDKTMLHIKRAESLQQAFTLWAMSPEFLRR